MNKIFLLLLNIILIFNVNANIDYIDNESEHKDFKTSTSLILSDHNEIFITVKSCDTCKDFLIKLDNNYHRVFYSEELKDFKLSDKKSFFKMKKVTALGNMISLDKRTLLNDFIIGSLVFKNMSIFLQQINNENKIPTIINKDTFSSIGMLGYEFLNKYVWKFDFENKKIEIASSIDSFHIKDEYVVLDNIRRNFLKTTYWNINIGNLKKVKTKFDLGYNGSILLPQKIFNNIKFSGDIVESSINISDNT